MIKLRIILVSIVLSIGIITATNAYLPVAPINDYQLNMTITGFIAAQGYLPKNLDKMSKSCRMLYYYMAVVASDKDEDLKGKSALLNTFKKATMKLNCPKLLLVKNQHSSAPLKDIWSKLFDGSKSSSHKKHRN